MKNIKLDKIVKIILFLLLAVIFYFVPYTHDDWAWGTSIGIKRLTDLFSNYNGRWAGNILVILLTRSRILKTIVITLTMAIMVELINRLINRKNNQIIYIASILILLMPYSIIAQTLAWTSGFTNYVISILLILIFIYLNRDIFSGQKANLSNWLIIPMLILGFIASLFIENLTIYNLVLSIFILTYEYCKSKKINLSNLFYFIGSISGTILMFSNGAYHNVINSTDGYRTIEQGNIILRSIRTYFGIIYNYLLQNNLMLVIVIGVLAFIIIYKFLKKNININKIKKSILYISQLIILGYLSYIIFIYVCDNVNIFINDRLKNYMEGIGALLFGISITATTVITINDKHKKFRMLFEIASIIIIVAPLFIVTPIGPRCFFANYIMFVILASEMFDYITNDTKLNIKNYLMFIAIMLVLFYLIIFGYIFKIETTRNEYIEENKLNEKVLYLPNLPFAKYMQGANPANKTFQKRFKLFYNIESDTKLVFMEYGEWKENVNN